MPPLPDNAHHDGTFLNCGMGHLYFALTLFRIDNKHYVKWLQSSIFILTLFPKPIHIFETNCHHLYHSSGNLYRATRTSPLTSRVISST